MIRFALAPDGVVTPDLAETLPGRGVWVKAARARLVEAASKRLFARGFKSAARLPDGQSADEFAALVESLLTRRALAALGLARKAGEAAVGADQVKALGASGACALVVSALDAADDGAVKAARTAKGAVALRAFSVDEISAALGRENARHVGLKAGPAATRFLRDARRLAGFDDRVTIVEAQSTASAPRDGEKTPALNGL